MERTEEIAVEAPVVEHLYFKRSPVPRQGLEERESRAPRRRQGPGAERAFLERHLEIAEAGRPGASGSAAEEAREGAEA